MPDTITVPPEVSEVIDTIPSVVSDVVTDGSSDQLTQLVEGVQQLTEYVQNYSLLITVCMGLIVGLLCVMILKKGG